MPTMFIGEAGRYLICKYKQIMRKSSVKKGVNHATRKKTIKPALEDHSVQKNHTVFITIDWVAWFPTWPRTVHRYSMIKDICGR